MTDQTRNLSPHKAAVAASWLWSKEYSQQGGGPMDFWDELSAPRKQAARALVDQILGARLESRAEADQL